MDDVVAVLDAAGSKEAAVFAWLEGGAMAALFAATHPARTRALVLYEAMPKMSWAPDYDWPPTREQREAAMEAFPWGDGSRIIGLWPRAANDPKLIEWAGRLERLSASPGTARKLFMMNAEVDIRAVLPSISVPTLVVHRAQDRFVDVRHSRYLAEHIPGARYVELSGDEVFSFGTGQDSLVDEVEEFLTGARRAPHPERVLATVMFSDIVGSTQRAAELGDRRWRDVLSSVEGTVKRELSVYRGRAIKSMGDGFLATFDGPARGVRCAQSIAEAVRSLGIEVRAGLHTGECELVGDDVAGMAVNIGARVAALAGAGEVLVSGTVKDLVVGSGIEFAERGEHRLKGVPGEWRLFSALGR
jgi:class 3 adenylate cyclase